MSRQQLHDGFFKAIFARRESARALLAVGLPANVVEWLDLSTLRLETASMVGDGLHQRFADLVYSVSAGDTPALIHLLLEHRSDPRPWTVLDMFGATAALLTDWRRKNPRHTWIPIVLPVVVYHGSGSPLE
jgi:predicted transposase YdaD